MGLGHSKMSNLMTSPDEQMNREMRRMSSKMGMDEESQRANMKKNAQNKKRASKNPNAPKVGFFKKIINFFKEAWQELKKVSWPSQKEVVNSTIIVLVCIVLVTILILGVDWAAEKLADLVYSK
jgi:preprotein translocase subunit SecE